jgi:hypothetical protein
MRPDLLARAGPMVQTANERGSGGLRHDAASASPGRPNGATVMAQTRRGDVELGVVGYQVVSKGGNSSRKRSSGAAVRRCGKVMRATDRAGGVGSVQIRKRIGRDETT